MPTLPTKPSIAINGSFNDWVASERIDRGDVAGYTLSAQAQGDAFYFYLNAPVAVGPNTTFWFNTDRNAATGYQIFGYAGGAEYNVNIKADGTAALYTGAAAGTLVLDNLQIAYSADKHSIEFAIPKTSIGTPSAFNVLYDVNDAVFGPTDYSTAPYAAYNNDITRTDASHKIGIVYSATTAAKYFSETAYSQLFRAVQGQAVQAGISYDVLTEADLTDIAKLANYDALVFPSFANVQASQVAAIADALERVSKQFGVGLVTAGNFMTNDETGAALAGDSYARMKTLFDATRVTGGFPADVSVKSSDTGHTVFTTLDAGALVQDYKSVAWDAFQSVSGTGQTIATQTVSGQTQTYAAALATQTGGKNVLFSTPGVMADSNLLWQAVGYTANDPGISVKLEISRNKGIVASRTDMDQAMVTADVSPGAGKQGIYDKLLPILTQWKQAYNFVGSYYVDIGNNPGNGETTNWAVSAPYYAQILAMGNELGSHSTSHPENTDLLTPAQIQTEFQGSKATIEQQMSAYLGRPFTVQGAAVPGATETLPTSKQIIQYYDYLTGGFSGIGAGYPGAFGYLTPDQSKVYLSPNTSFDFTLVQYQNLGAAGASAAWAAEWNKLIANAALPVVLWPWHDYGATAFQSNGAAASPYTTQLYTDWIARAYQAGMEFVTEADLASRIKSFDATNVTTSVSGSTVNVTVGSSHAGTFALDVEGAGTQVIKNAGSWYAYDSDQVFLPEAGGNYAITLGAAQDDVTHISALPMRGDLLSVTGDGLNLAFSVVGEGDVTVALGATAGRTPVLTGSGAAIASRTADEVVVRLTGLGQHDVSLRMQPTDVRNDVSGDGRGDIVWQNASGAPMVWAMQGSTVGATLRYANPGASWRVVGTGDLNGDGRDDLVWQNGNGTPSAWIMGAGGASVTAYAQLPNPGASWRLAGAGDLDGDGKADLLWQNNNGAVSSWLMDGASVRGYVNFGNPGTAWHLIGSGDLNGDGRADLAWQNDNGAVSAWLMGGSVGAPSVAAYANFSNPGADWALKALGDLNGDGRDDLAFQNRNGLTSAWLMGQAGASVDSCPVFSNPGTSWRLANTADANGDGRADLVWQNASGLSSLWLMGAGGTKVDSNPVFDSPGPDWRTV